MKKKDILKELQMLGIDEATYIYEKNITLEEYIQIK